MTEFHPTTSRELHKIKFTRPLPDLLTDLAFEAIEALRAALDHAAFATAPRGGKTKPKSACFPIASSAVDLDRVIKGRCKDISPDIVAVFRSFRPYKGGTGF